LADVTQDSYNEDLLHTLVAFQKGRDVVDYELNEAQQILRGSLYRTLVEAANGNVGASYALTPGSNGNGYKASETGPVSASVSIAAGYLTVDGIVIRLANSTTSTPPAYAGVARTDVLYIAVSETEVNDPAALVKVGVTSKRKKLSVSFGWSTTGLGGVPASSASEVWKGGTRYYPIASVARGASNITNANITDLRKMLPPTVCASITRQSGFQVKALVGTILETPDGTLLSKSGVITTDLDPDGTQSAAIRALKVRISRDTGLTHTPLSMGEVFATPSAVGGINAGFIGEESDSVVGNRAGAVRFWDANIEAGKAAGQQYVDLSGSANGAFALRKNELAPAQSDGAKGSIFRSLNARFTATIGNGTTTFGDFNGATAITDALTFIAAYGAFTSVELQIKAGTYTVNNYAIPSGITRLTLRGVGSKADTIIQSTSATSFIFSWVSGRVLEIHKCQLQAADTTSTIAVQGSCALWLFDTRVIRLEFRMTDPVGDSLSSGTKGKTTPLHVERCFFSNSAGVSVPGGGIFYLIHTALLGYKFKVSIRDSEFHMADSEALLKVTHTGGLSGTTTEYDFVFDQCKIWLGKSAVAVAGTKTMTYNVGVLALDPTNASPLQCASLSMEYNNCSVKGPTSAPSAGNTYCLFFVVPKNGSGGMLIRKFKIRGGEWDVGPMGTDSVSPAVLSTNDAEVYPWLQNVDFEDTLLDASSTARYGALSEPIQTAVGSVIANAWLVARVHKFRARNLRLLPGGVRLTGGGSDAYIKAAIYDIDGMEILQSPTDTNQLEEGTGGSTPNYRLILDQENPASYKYPRSLIRGLSVCAYGSGNAETAVNGLVNLRSARKVLFDDCTLASNDTNGATGTKLCLGLTSTTEAYDAHFRGCYFSDCRQAVRYDPIIAAKIKNNVVFEDCTFRSQTTSTQSNTAGNGNPVVIISNFNAFGVGAWRFYKCRWDVAAYVSNANPALYQYVLGLYMAPGAWGIGGGNTGFGSGSDSHLVMDGNNAPDIRARVVSTGTQDAIASFANNRIGRIKADAVGPAALAAEPSVRGVATGRGPAWTIYNDIIEGQNHAMLETPLWPRRLSTSRSRMAPTPSAGSRRRF